MATYQIIQPVASGATHTISNGAVCSLSYPNGISGIGLPAITRDLRKLTNLEGALDYGYKLEPREILLNLYYTASTAADADQRRDLICRIFRPFKDPLKLRVTRDDGDVRQINVHTLGMVDLPSSQRVGYDQAFSVRLLAPDPIWYDPNYKVFTFAPAFSGHTLDLNYTAHWEEYPVIKIYGAVTNFFYTTSLVVPSGSESYSLFLANVPAGDVWTFDLRHGYKTLKDSAGNSKLGTLDINTYNAMSGIALWPDPLKTAGLNSITLSYATKDTNHKIEVFAYWRYPNL